MKKMEKQPPAKFDINAIRGVRQRVGSQILQPDIEQADDRKPANQHEQRVVTLMAEHLVDHHLKEQRRDERENLHEKRGEKHMRQRPPIPPDRRKEPFEAESLRIDPHPAQLAGNEHGFRGLLEQVVERQRPVGPRQWIDQTILPRRDAPSIDLVTA